MNNLKDKVTKLPQSPGVYIFKDAQGRIIYIGKAKSLKKRVQTYFKRPLDSKTQALVSKIADLEYRLTATEAQAQILEAVLIKEQQPQYNIDLKDDKSFPLIKITAEKFPIVSICRIKKPDKKDKSIYFGPYTNVKLLRQAFKFMRRIFGFRSCKTMPSQACLYYRLKLCPAPCTTKIKDVEYKKIIRNIRMFLESREDELINILSRQMDEEAAKQNFEKAAELRDQIIALSALGKTASVFNRQEALEDLKDLLGLSKAPLRIEAFDISNISGQEATGSMISFYKGLPDKDNYRRFRIKTVENIDDYAMIREIVARRYLRLTKEKLKLPDLILIDGGRGHLLVAQEQLNKLNLDIPLISIAKEEENIYTKDKKNALKLNSDTAGLNLIRYIRDEAHRFALKYHHLLHKKKIIGR